MSPNPNSTSSSAADSLSLVPETNMEKYQAGHFSSYPKIWKFPSYRNFYFKNAVEWMEGKKSDEAIGDGLWRVHDKLYNLEPFISQHPGGSEWISMTNGTDITEAFETSHVVNASNVRRILAKYYVKEADTQRNSQYTFEENGFYKVLQRRAEPVLKKIGTGPTSSVVFLQDSLALLFLVLFYFSSRTDYLPLQLLTGLVLGMSTVCAHNFCHLKDNWRKYYLDLSLASSYEWRVGHGLSHHLFPNTIMDYEVYLFEPFIELSSNKNRNWIQKYLAHGYLYVLYSQYFGFEFLKRVLLVVTGKQKPRLENILPMLELFVCIQLSSSVLDGFRISFTILSLASFYFAFVGEAMAAHHHPKSFHEGDDVRSDPDFGLCQLDVTKASIEEYTKNIAFAVTTFSEHPLHHLFPTVCHSKLHLLQPVVQQVLAKYSEKIHSLNSFDKFAGIHYQLSRNSRPD